ncbi:MAG: hypothetical protein J0L97_05715 [Alphaproteobacteria bacterium]|nr:hypothetical protein [Alphaproteobacteria bacterium]
MPKPDPRYLDPRYRHLIGVSPDSLNDADFNRMHSIYQAHTCLGDFTLQSGYIREITAFCVEQHQGGIVLVSGQGRTLKTSTVKRSLEQLEAVQPVVSHGSPFNFYTGAKDIGEWLDGVIAAQQGRPVVHMQEIALDPSIQNGFEGRLERLLGIMQKLSEPAYREAGVVAILDIWLPPDGRVFHDPSVSEPRPYRELRNAVNVFRSDEHHAPVYPVTMPVNIPMAGASLWHAINALAGEHERIFWSYANRLGMHPAGNTNGDLSQGVLFDLYESVKRGEIKDLESFVLRFTDIFTEPSRDVFQTPPPPSRPIVLGG